VQTRISAGSGSGPTDREELLADSTGDFVEDNRPRLPHDQSGYLRSLRRPIAVVELERHDIALTAVDERVSAEVFTQKPTVSPPIPLDPRDFRRM
jgi:hypothetical protein